jgi:hypothetical protein
MEQLQVPLKAVGFAVAMATASMANATTTDLGTIGPGYSQYFSIERLGVFEDFYNFSLAAAANLDVKRTITFTMDDAFNEVRSGFNGLTRGLFDADTNTQVSWSSYEDHGQVYYYTNLDAGDYYFKVSGEAWKAADFVPNPRYNALVNIAAAPVPEPEAYAMLLAGLGILGTVIKRRSNSY